MSNLLYGPRIPSSQVQTPEIERSWKWIIAAVALVIGFITGLGLGVKFHWRNSELRAVLLGVPT